MVKWRKQVDPDLFSGDRIGAATFVGPLLFFFTKVLPPETDTALDCSPFPCGPMRGNEGTGLKK